ncbi:MAG: DUF3267 domain-containing protein [Gemmatimonadales bacterium]
MSSSTHAMEPADYSLGMLTANLLTVVAAGPLVAVLALAWAARWGWASLAAGVYGLLDPWILLLAVLPGIAAHELIHAVAWAAAARRPFAAMELGVRWRSLAPYAHPREPVPARAYRIGAVMPLLVVGIVPSLAAIALGAPRLMAWGLFFVFTAGGDVLVLWLIRGVPGGRLVEDHPTRVGCVVAGGQASGRPGDRAVG